jgi:hypothetical protein
MVTPPQGQRFAIIEDYLLAVLRGVDEARHAAFTLRDGDVRWRFVEQAIEILRETRDIIAATPPPPPSDRRGESTVLGDEIASESLLSMNDRNAVVTLLQVVVAWGIYPSLLPHIGIPINARLMRTSFDMGTTRSGCRSELLVAARVLLDFAKLEDFESELSARHTADLFAAFLQLQYAPLPDGAP